ncbi:SPW repeat protein [Sinomonas terrae]|uniref:SPW repeat protein n=1 Tax=Sinomonas terrae TaxID=2908838 RepID=UPI00355870EB
MPSRLRIGVFRTLGVPLQPRLEVILLRKPSALLLVVAFCHGPQFPSIPEDTRDPPRQPGIPWLEYARCALGVLLFISPWIGAYYDHTGAAWTSWITGTIAAVATAAPTAPRPSLKGGSAGPSSAAYRHTLNARRSGSRLANE